MPDIDLSSLIGHDRCRATNAKACPSIVALASGNLEHDPIRMNRIML